MVEAEPVLLALIAADKIITEAQNNKKTIVGTFTNFFAASFPALFPPWAIYFSFTNVVDEHTFSINVVNDRTQQVIFSAGGQCTSAEPSAVVELVVPAFPVTFPEKGVYTIIAHLDGQPLASRILTVTPVAAQGGPPATMNDASQPRGDN